MSLLDDLFGTEINHNSFFHNRSDCYQCEEHSMGFMVVLPILVIVGFFLYGYYVSHKDAPPKRVFIEDIAGPSESVAVSKAVPVSTKSVAKKSHPTHLKSGKVHHQETRH